MPKRPVVPTNWTVPLLLTSTPGILASVVLLILEVFGKKEESPFCALPKLKPRPVKTGAEVKEAFWPPVIRAHSPLTSVPLVSVAQKILPSCGGIKAPAGRARSSAEASTTVANELKP